MKLADAVDYISENCRDVDVYNHDDGSTAFAWNIIGCDVEYGHATPSRALIGFAKAHQKQAKEEESQAEQAERREYERLKATYG